MTKKSPSSHSWRAPSMIDGARQEWEEGDFFPFLAGPVDDRAAGAADHVIDGAARLAVRPGVDPGTDHLDVAGHGREDGPTCGGVDVFHEHVVERVRLQLGELEQRGVRALPAVVVESLRPRGRPDRAKPRRAEAALGEAHDLSDVLAVLGMTLLGQYFEVPYDWGIEAVEPDHRLASLVSVVVQRRGGREHQDARVHQALVSLDGRIRALTAHHEAKRIRRVPVRRSNLAG